MDSKNSINERLNWLPTESALKADVKEPILQFVFDPPYRELTKITDNIYLTSITGITKSNFETHNFQCVFDFCSKDYYTPQGVEYQKIRILDTVQQNICHLFDSIADEIHANDKNGRKTVLHCFAGISRSASMVIAYLMKYHRLPLRDAFNYVRERRNKVLPNKGFFGQLIDYELHLFGKTSVKIIKVRNEDKKLATEVPDFFVGEQYKDLLDKIFGHIERKEFPNCFPVLPFD